MATLSLGQPSSAPMLALGDDIWYLVIKHLEKDLDYKAAKSYRQVCWAWHGWIQKLIPMNKENVDFRKQGDVAAMAREAGTVWRGAYRVAIWGNWDRAHELRHLATFAATFARRWTRVTTLSIEQGEWRAAYTTPTLFRDLSLYSITTLILRAVTFPNTDTIARLIVYLPRLEHVFCYKVGFTAVGLPFRSPVFPASVCSRRRRGLQFTLGDFDIRSTAEVEQDLVLFQCLGEFLRHADYLNPSLVISLHAPCYRPQDYFEKLQKLLDDAGPSLQAIDINMHMMFDTNRTFPQHGSGNLQQVPSMSAAPSRCSLSIAKNTQLRRVAIMFSDCNDCPSAAHVLASVTSTHIREIQLRRDSRFYVLPYDRPEDEIDKFCREYLHPVDKVLTASGNKFINLERVDVDWVYSRPSISEFWRAYGKSYLPELSKQSEVALSFRP